MILESIPGPCMGITLNHDPSQLFVLSKDSIYEFFKGDEYLDNSYYKFGTRKYSFYVYFYLYSYVLVL